MMKGKRRSFMNLKKDWEFPDYVLSRGREFEN